MSPRRWVDGGGIYCNEAEDGQVWERAESSLAMGTEVGIWSRGKSDGLRIEIWY
jgi:hypothetical protein